MINLICLKNEQSVVNLLVKVYAEIFSSTKILRDMFNFSKLLYFAAFKTIFKNEKGFLL